jgi:hypothetical protein
VDIDMRFEPERDELFRLVDKLKIELDINLELASPPDFIPAVSTSAPPDLRRIRLGKLPVFRKLQHVDGFVLWVGS